MKSANLTKDRRNFNHLIKEARIGHRESQYEVGLMYANGIGVDQDFVQAVYWVRQSAERGFAAAQYLLATRYANGEAVNQDDHEALKWLVKASDQEHPKAIYKLARFYANAHWAASHDLCLKAANLGVAPAQLYFATEFLGGRTDTEGLQQAFYWTLQAAEQGLAAAQCAVADLYVQGRNIAMDLPAAYDWYRKAARQYFAPALVAMSLLDQSGFEQGRGHGSGNSRFGAHERRRDAVRWVDSAEIGDSNAKYCLGLMYQNGWSIAQDVSQARHWFAAAATLGHVKAQTALARLLEAESNFQDALELHWKIATQDASAHESCAALGKYYLQGHGTQADDFMGLLWTMKAVDMGDAEAVDVLAKLATGDDRRISAACLKRAAESGSIQAQYALGKLCESGRVTGHSPHLAADWYRRAAAQGHCQAQCALGLLYLDGKGVAKDAAQAREWFLQAAQQGDAKAQWNLALMLISGTAGVKKDLKQAFVLCQKAAQQGFVPAQASLGILFAKMKKPAKAVEWWRLAAEQGDPEAQFNLASAYMTGTGIEQDKGRALDWLVKAAEQGVVSAQSKLGLLFATGEGIARDPIEAHKWFLLAGQAGDAAALSNTRHSEGQFDAMQIAEASRRAKAWQEAKLVKAPR